MEMLIILALAIGAMWLMTSRTRKQQREAADFRANLEVGQEVMTGSGLYGTIVDVDGDVITLESTPGNHTRWIRAAIARLVPPTAATEDDDVDEGDEVYEDDEQYTDEVAEADHTTHEGVSLSKDQGAHRLEVPDDLSTLDERRRDEGPGTR
jgi:preprotein translocase subunit YajC